MNRIFKVQMSHPQSCRSDDMRVAYEVVAPTAEKAITKARAQARRDYAWRGAWLVEELLHRGAAV